MYKLFIRKLLFLIPPEKIHNLIVVLLGIASKIPGVSWILKKTYLIEDPALTKEVCGISFTNPVGLAAGFDKNAKVYKEFRFFGFGFIEIGTVTPKGQAGNPKPRSFRLPKDKALINRMGFNNMGVDAAVECLKKRPKGLVIGGNIGKNTATKNKDAIHDYEYCFKALYDYVDYFVINVSCPNISDLNELQDQDNLQAILSRIIEIRSNMSVNKPVFLKISPDLNWKQVDETLSIINKTGVNGIVATNTTITRNNLSTDQDKIDRIGQGGLSGQPLRERSTEMIRYIHKKTSGKLPIIGVGGIMSVEDALEKIEAGADLIQIYTGFIYEGPGLIKRILKMIKMKED